MSKSNATVDGKEGIDRRLRSELMALSSTSGLLGPIGTVASILLDCFDAIKAAAKNQQEYEDLATDLAQLSELLVKHFGENTSNTTFGSVAGISKQVVDEAMDVKNKSKRGVSTGRLFIDESDEDELMQHFRRIQSLFQQLHMDLNASTQSIANEIRIVLAELAEWANSPDAPPVLWMNGMAGTGKTTIAYGLDECENLKSMSCILDVTFHHVSQLPIKFFVTSRPIPEIVGIMGAHPGSSTVVLLHDIEMLLVSTDIELYLKKELGSISPDVSNAAIKLLVEQSGVLFIYAAALLHYINFEAIHNGAWNQSTRLASTLHTSFQDFIFDRERSGRCFCDVVEYGPVLAYRCFQVMKDQLRMNICDLPSSFVPDDKVEDLHDQIKKNISPSDTRVPQLGEPPSISRADESIRNAIT
ncbi:WD40 repeat-like protein [Rhizoctonia solani]|uniref:WD40 repeat-like protein n=1 Tax=Rhizoctonia solani TaxID=456999 RepID=A0A8H7M977_9AGAM|nr:WD40 repeat-like protein [Rhizoctonia solani]